jgi:septation ring formation regulator EzrA
MANIYEELSNAFETKLHKLISDYMSLKNENSVLKSEIERKQTDLMLAHQEILTLRKSQEDLRIAQSLGQTDEDRNESKQRLNQMVQEIDKCLALLDE